MAVLDDQLAMHQAGGGGSELLAAQLELRAPTLVACAGVRAVLIGNALSDCVELIEGSHTILWVHRAGRP